MQFNIISRLLPRWWLVGGIWLFIHPLWAINCDYATPFTYGSPQVASNYGPNLPHLTILRKNSHTNIALGGRQAEYTGLADGVSKGQVKNQDYQVNIDLNLLYRWQLAFNMHISYQDTSYDLPTRDDLNDAAGNKREISSLDLGVASFYNQFLYYGLGLGVCKTKVEEINSYSASLKPGFRLAYTKDNSLASLGLGMLLGNLFIGLGGDYNQVTYKPQGQPGTKANFFTPKYGIGVNIGGFRGWQFNLDISQAQVPEVKKIGSNGQALYPSVKETYTSATLEGQYQVFNFGVYYLSRSNESSALFLDHKLSPKTSYLLNFGYVPRGNFSLYFSLEQTKQKTPDYTQESLGGSVTLGWNIANLYNPN